MCCILEVCSLFTLFSPICKMHTILAYFCEVFWNMKCFTFEKCKQHIHESQFRPVQKRARCSAEKGWFGSVIMCTCTCMPLPSGIHLPGMPLFLVFSHQSPCPRLCFTFAPFPPRFPLTNFSPSRSPPLQAPRRRRPLSAWWSRVGGVGPAEEPRHGRTEPRVRPRAQRPERGAARRRLRAAGHHDHAVTRGPAAARGNRLLSSLWDKDYDPELAIEGQKLLLQRLCRLCCW